VIEKGVKVRVLSGPFADKVGVVGELDGRGAARVLLGLLSTRIEVANLEMVVEGRERPALQSSHRKPAAPAPRKTR
jgi:transcription antitermination factor NusG